MLSGKPLKNSQLPCIGGGTASKATQFEKQLNGLTFFIQGRKHLLLLYVNAFSDCLISMLLPCE